jgi:hypothetical protein
MRLKHLLIVPAAAVALSVVGMSAASAGEVTGNGKPVKAVTVAHSICAFSGLADGGEGEPAGPGAPPQNWGQIPKEVRDVIATQGEHPGDACNGHTGFLSGGGGGE